MKKTIYLIVSVIALFSCKKESNISPSTLTNPTNSITCVDNPNINFTSIGTSIGKFGECIKDIDGNTYKTVTIGNQTWMAENLKVSKYNDGTAIPNITENSQWKKNTTGAWCNYNNSDSLGKIYGKLYNWYAVSPTTNGNKNVCPTGWHVPSTIEINLLRDYLGGESVAGNTMREIAIIHWNSPNIGATNSSLFSAVPSGLRNPDGVFESVGINCLLWSSNDGNNSWCYYLTYKDDDLTDWYTYKTNGFSVRCLKD